MKRKFLLLLAVALVAVLGAQAKVIKITAAEQAEEFFALNGGDTLILAEGIWDDLRIKLRSVDGTRAIPVVFKGETAGKTILRGTSTVSFSGYGVVVEDLWFEDPISDGSVNAATIQFRTSDAVHAYESVLRNVRMTGFGTDLKVDGNHSQWLTIYGTNNIVENCSFEDKAWIGCMVAVWPSPGEATQPNHTVRNNYFTRPRVYYNERGEKENSQEAFRTSTYIYSMTDSRCLIENNVFEKCNGEMEFISVKSGNNTFRGNVFLECEGTLTLRHGNGNIVQDNYFDGRNVPLTGGIRIFGEDHIVSGNYMQDLGGANDAIESAPGYYSAVCVVLGITETALNGFYQVKNTIIENNVAIDCYQGLAINEKLSPNQARPTPPPGAAPVPQVARVQEQPFLNSRVQGNTFVSTKIGVEVTNDPAPENIVWADNVFQGGEIKGITASEAGSVAASAPIERKPMPVFDFGPEWKYMYE